jgi:outer membrane murein-binding lipoprotein Lpp
MNRKTGSVIALAVLLLAGAWLWASLHTKATEMQSTRLNKALDQVEQDMGVYNADSARVTPAPRRAIKVSNMLTQRANEHRRLLDSLTRAEREDLGDHTLSDSGGSGYYSR